ncbi:hypothetical protein K435DRAFT_789897 [Dendrothele bispora CBS 962.96]|uniref:Uncharacterized protein n=1 Tax=Dendrothele bispora (strain CBS 962.96) TaxID=1314807 RepID=A0A4S8MT75_DENBC|nr:hypothetical protein K435DRAFT_789897 [Dendrothele bispora CBS 962.96]
MVVLFFLPLRQIYSTEALAKLYQILWRATTLNAHINLDLILYRSAISKGKWGRRVGSNNLVKDVYHADRPHVLKILAKAPETALSTFLCSWALITAYPLMTMKHQTFSVIVTRDSQMIGGECLEDFMPVALMDYMPGILLQFKVVER